MSDQVAQQLKQLIGQYGWQLANEPSRVNALLRDLCPQHKREVHVLSAVAKEGLTQVLLQDGEKISASILLPRLAERLHDELGTDQALAIWAVTAWATALGLKVAPVQAKAPVISRQESQAAREAKQAEQRRQAEERTARTALMAGRYQVRGDNGEMIYDTTTGLEWQRCSLGQTWNGRTCTGEASIYTWDEARAAADQVPGWRLPTLDELKTLIYCSSGQPAQFGCQCSGNYQRPTIVTEAFPNTPSSHFWSASPYAGDSDFAWGVFFNYGRDGNCYKSRYYRVRLVRGGQ